MLIDTHSHIYSEEFMNESEEVITRAIEAGVEKIILPNIDSSSINPMLKLSNTFPENCFPTIGIHPTSIDKDFQDELDVVRYWLGKKKFCAIGEIGLDLYWDKTYKEEQTEAFSIQLNLAYEHNLPVIVHVRDAFDEVFEVLEKASTPKVKGVFHSFTGTIEQAQKAIEMGFLIGVNGIVTFKNSGLDKVIEKISPEHLLLETDSPYLAPVPYRGKRNESSYVTHVCTKIAEIHGVTEEELEEITTRNAQNLFRI